jgi:protein KRI1
LNSVLNPTSRSPSPEPLTHTQEQATLRDETIAAFHKNIGEDEDDLLVPREKTKDELQLEEEEYKSFLEREVGDINTLLGEAQGGNESEHGQEQDKRRKKEKKKRAKEISEAESGPRSKKKSKEEADQQFLVE